LFLTKTISIVGWIGDFLEEKDYGLLLSGKVGGKIKLIFLYMEAGKRHSA
jgi:hypothetical protein